MTTPASIPDPRLCIIGAGGLSSNRIYPYIGAAGGQLVGVCDLDEEKAARNARRFGGAVYSDFKKMLAGQKPDGVLVCVGPQAHAQLAIEIMRLGYPVYTEKPPAESAASALQVARVAKETGLLCTTAFMDGEIYPGKLPLALHRLLFRALREQDADRHVPARFRHSHH